MKRREKKKKENVRIVQVQISGLEGRGVMRWEKGSSGEKKRKKG